MIPTECSQRDHDASKEKRFGNCICIIAKKPTPKARMIIERNPEVYWRMYNKLKRDKVADVFFKSEAAKILVPLLNERNKEANAAFYKRVGQNPSMYLDNIRERYSRLIESKYVAFVRRLSDKILTENALGYVQSTIDPFELPKNGKKSTVKDYGGDISDEFKAWLESQMNELVDEILLEQCIIECYDAARRRVYEQKQIVERFNKRSQIGKTITNQEDFEAGEKRQFLTTGKQSQAGRGIIQSVLTKAMAALKGIASSMVQSTIGMISDGISRKQPPEKIFKDVQEHVEKQQKKAVGATIDTTTRAGAESQLHAFGDLGHEYVVAIIETMEDDRVCQECQKIAGEEMPIEQAKNLIPIHKNCRCSWKIVSQNPLTAKLSQPEKKKRQKETLYQTIERLGKESEEIETQRLGNLDALDDVEGNAELDKKLVAKQKRLDKKAEENQVAIDQAKINRVYKWFEQLKIGIAETRRKLGDKVKKIWERRKDASVENAISEDGAEAFTIEIETLLGDAIAITKQLQPVIEIRSVMAEQYAEYERMLRLAQDLRDDAARKLEQSKKFDFPLKKYEYVEQNTKSLNDGMVKPTWKKYNAVEKRSVKVYSDFEYYVGITRLVQLGKPTSYLRSLRESVKNGTLTDEQKAFLETCTTKNRNTGKENPAIEMLEHFTNMQCAAAKYKTKKPLLLRRRIQDLGLFRDWQIGEERFLEGIISAYATQEAFDNPDNIRNFGKATTEFRVPVGTHCIPIGNEGMADHNLDEIVLPHNTKVRVLEFQITGDTPHMVVEVIPTEVELL
jgi:SPP1 gp7 family putative phage head morphogenesis protein